jgi:glycosyltransferase involved in cell wall biosynthesis
MELIPAWRSRKTVSIAFRSMKLLPGHFLDDIKDLCKFILINLFKELLSGSKFYGKAKSAAISLRLLDRVVEPGNAREFNDRVKSNDLAEDRHKPKIFISACVSPDIPGGWKYNGGIKEYNCLVKLLRQKGYEAYIVTYDGNYEPWLVEHQPCISLSTFLDEVKSNKNIRCISSWAVAKAFIQECENLYFWDMELCVTENEHFPLLANLYRSKIRNVAGISRTIQAWHMAHFQRSCVLLPNLLDESLWTPQAELRQVFRIGYMNEGAHTDSYIELIRNITNQRGLNLEFHLVKGVEAEVLDEMRSCDVYLSMNIGKDVLWGEGCPRTVIESLSTGCVVIAFDVIGNRETLQDNFNGILVQRFRPELMAEALVRVYSLPGELERLRSNALSLIYSCHTLEARWAAVQEFLDL